MVLPTKAELRKAHTAHKTRVIIDVVGLYTTRDGSTVDITEIGDPARSTAFCKGSLLSQTPTGRTRRTWNSWMPNGANKFIGIHDKDIVRKVLKRERQ